MDLSLIRCREVVRALSSEEYDDMPLAGRLKVRLHLLVCRDCQHYRAQLDSLGRAARAARDQPIDRGELERLEQKIGDAAVRAARPPESGDPPR